MTFCELISLQCASVKGQCGTEHLFRLNDINDPDATGGTHKPYGYSQMSAFYSHYLVRATRVTLATGSNVTINGRNHLLLVQSQPSTATYSLTGNAASDVIEKSQGTAIYLNAVGDSSTKNFAFPMHVVEGISAQQWQSDLPDYAAAFGSDPAKTPFLRIAAANIWDTNTDTIEVMVTLCFEVELFDRIVMASSN